MFRIATTIIYDLFFANSLLLRYFCSSFIKINKKLHWAQLQIHFP
ncbi:hypothetical protein FEM21_03410 [Flavobacterium seoulense]|uniref:Uncharacterized protein n=1 Tax=Flavobacterium seoulense TaxID=1492738 RepID=A0A066WWB2_9FLAO|nr:hypothetical protein FEM21_03410 [Flavobacterium seoulense]